MKKLLYSFAVLLLATACGQDTFTVKGTVTDADRLPEGAVIALTDATGAEIATAPITDGTFTLKGDANPEKMYNVKVSWPERTPRDRSWATAFIPEKGTINVTLAPEESTVEGGSINKAYRDFQQQMRDLFTDFQEKATAMEAEGQEKVEALYKDFNDKVASLSKDAIGKNAKNYIALAALQNIIYDLDLDELKSTVAKCGDFVKNDETTKRIIQCKEAELETAEGKPFVDFAGKTPEGAEVKLSDYVGKGKWVLTDFWASWCGPCMREIPNIKKTHETLSGDNFTVLGVAVWERNGDNTASAQTMEKMGMTWPQIFVGDDKTPTDSYGIVGIPALILFAPDGTICKRGEELRGENMLETISGLINP